jgi:hypothetical protein
MTSDNESDLRRRIQNEVTDSFDEELELEIDDERLAELLNAKSDHPHSAD